MTDVDALIGEAIAPLQRALEELEHNRDQTKETLDALNDDINKLHRMLRIACPDAEKPAPVNGVKKRKPSLNAATVKEIEERARQHLAENDSVTQADLRAKYGYTSSVTATAFNILREENILRQSGQKGNLKYFRLTQPGLEGKTYQPTED